MSTQLRIAAGLLAGLVVIAANIPPRITYAALRTLERSADNNFETLIKEDPLSMLGYTRGVYLDGYGVVFSAEVELAASAAPNPFRPAYTKEDVQRLREKKKVRIAYLKESMQNMLLSFSNSLETVPLNQNVALAVTIPYFRWEDADGMPRQIVMSAPRKALLDARAGNTKGLAAVLKVQEFN
jgi:hypothetical protein